jgi:hypothetical protein
LEIADEVNEPWKRPNTLSLRKEYLGTIFCLLLTSVGNPLLEPQASSYVLIKIVSLPVAAANRWHLHLDGQTMCK